MRRQLTETTMAALDQQMATTRLPPGAPYNRVAKWFHWITVVLLAIAIPVGVVIKYITPENSYATKLVFYAIHESAGVTIFLVASARLLWRLISPPPPLSEVIPAPMRKAANAVHHTLYALLIIQPILGFVATNAQGFPLQGATAYLGLIDFPKFMEANKAIADPVQLAHNTIGLILAALIVVHIAAVVFHQAIRRDETLLRMV
jgi:cytochrome b561